jgi:hypothetical protein
MQLRIQVIGRVCHQAVRLLVHPAIQPPNSHPHPPRGLQHDPGFLRAKEMEQAARLARLERSKAETAAIVAAAAAAAQKALEEHSWKRSLSRRNIMRNGSDGGRNG